MSFAIFIGALYLGFLIIFSRFIYIVNLFQKRNINHYIIIISNYLLQNRVGNMDKNQNHEQLLNKQCNRYTFLQLIGSGISSRVYKSYDGKKQRLVAIKVIPRQFLNQNTHYFQLIKNEITILKQLTKLKAQFILEFYEVFQTPRSICIVTELCQETLQSYFNRIKKFSEDHAVFILKQLLNGFKNLHEINVMHRDFKLENILVKGSYFKISDLGFAKKLQKQQLTNTILGTPLTVAPQVSLGEGYCHSADIWSLGAVFYILIYGEHQFLEMGKGSNLIASYLKKGHKILHRSKRISHEAKDFIERCLIVDPKKRIQWPQIYGHPLITKQKIIIVSSILNVDALIKQNHTFYKHQQPNPEVPPDQFAIFKSFLRNSRIKQKIRSQVKQIEQQIQQIVNKSQNITRIQAAEQKLKLEAAQLNLATQYMKYFNHLSCAFKFLRYQLIQNFASSINKNSEVSVEAFLFLYLKKTYHNINRFLVTIKTNQNIFKINSVTLWQKFNHSLYYEQLTKTIHFYADRCKQMLLHLQKLVKNSNLKCEFIMKNVRDDRIELSSQQFNQFKNKSQVYLKKGLLSIYDYFNQNGDRNEYSLNDFLKSYIYLSQRQSMNQENKYELNGLPSPDQFDESLEKPLSEYSVIQLRDSLFVYIMHGIQ